MDRRTIIAAIALSPFMLGGCATSASLAETPAGAEAPTAAEAPAVPDIVTGDLNDVPESADGGPYVVLIPTTAETRPSPELTAALQNLARALAQRRGTGTSHVAYVANTASGEFDATVTTRAVDALNQTHAFGLTTSTGPILVISVTHPTRSAGQDAAAWVFTNGEPTQLAQSIIGAVHRADRHDVPSAIPHQPNPLGGVNWLWGYIFNGADPKPAAPRP
jgi:hypothetical protein